MKRAGYLFVYALILGILGTWSLYHALSSLDGRTPVAVIGVMLEGWALCCAGRAAWLCSVGIGGCKARVLDEFEITGPVRLRLVPIRGTGPGLVELEIRPVGVLVMERVAYQVHVLLAGAGAVLKEWRDKGSTGSMLTYAIGHAGAWELSIEVLWPKRFFDRDLLKHVRQFRQAMRFEVVVRGRCTEVTAPPAPVFEPVDEGGGERGFEVVMSKGRGAS